MKEQSNSSNEGIGLFGLIFMALLVLKLCGVIGWSWWWVTAPLWGPLVLVLAIAAIAFPIYLVAKK